MQDFDKNLINALTTGFLDSNHVSIESLQPHLVLNNFITGEKTLTTIISNLEKCDSFWFSVAFLSRSGVAVLQNTLQKLDEKNIKGKILVSQYLNFTQPEALKALLKFKNIEIKIVSDVNYHGKGYLFKIDKDYIFLLGSSNLTANALCKNYELNLTSYLSKNSKLIQDILNVFHEMFKRSKVVDSDFLDWYGEEYSKRKLPSLFVNNHIIDNNIKPNSMQVKALKNLENIRSKGESKSLIISATGTGKTVLSALDAKQFKANKLLFVVHRANIAKKSLQTFVNIFEGKKSMGLYSGIDKDTRSDFIFSTVQTITKPSSLSDFDKNAFDYIIIDESHRSGANSYKNIIDYFNPKFLLGMTATPERTDGFDIFSLFDHNLAYEIRLHQAMKEELICPFHYFGVSDITIEGENPNDLDFNMLISSERVSHIIEKSQFYGCDNGEIKSLVFCSRNQEASELAYMFNSLGHRSTSLSGQNSEECREKSIRQLEDGSLNYIFTVDIFNEGVDIPKVNQIIMLRPTQSAIVFVQQLGRGLRNTTGKDYLTVIDFIGNYQNNFLIPIALYGDYSYNKDSIRKLVSSGSAFIPGSSTVNFDDISKQRIFKSIDSSNLKTKKHLVKDYELIKQRLGKIPLMMDFVNNNSRDPFQFVEYSKSSYLSFVKSIDEELNCNLSEEGLSLLGYLSKEINNGQRLEESLMLQTIIEKGEISDKDFCSLVHANFGYTPSKDTIVSAVDGLNLKFVTEKYNGKLTSIGRFNQYKNIEHVGGILMLGQTLLKHIENDSFKEYLNDSIEYSIFSFNEKHNIENFVNGFQRYKKYSRKDVFRILNWKENPVAQNVGGYMVSKNKKNCPIFVNYHKEDDISDTTKYEDRFINQHQFSWMSKSKRSLSSPDVIAIQNSNETKMRLPLFVKKNNDEGLEFYYIGDLRAIKESFIEDKMPSKKGEVSVVRVNFDIDQPVEENIYKYITNR